MTQLRRMEAGLARGATYRGRRFVRVDSATGGIDSYLWFTDGTIAGTRPIDLDGLGATGGATSITLLGAAGGWLYLGIRARDHEFDLWRLRASEADLAPAATTDVVEFYRASRDTYFLTGLPNEIAAAGQRAVPRLGADRPRLRRLRAVRGGRQARTRSVASTACPRPASTRTSIRPTLRSIAT